MLVTVLLREGGRRGTGGEWSHPLATTAEYFLLLFFQVAYVLAHLIRTEALSSRDDCHTLTDTETKAQIIEVGHQAVVEAIWNPGRLAPEFTFLATVPSGLSHV